MLIRLLEKFKKIYLKLIEKIRKNIIINITIYKYILFFFITLFFVNLSAYLDTILVYNEMEMRTYWLISFIKIVCETVIVSVLIAFIIDILNQIKNEDIQKKHLWKKVISETIKDMNDLADSFKEFGSESNNIKYLKASDEIKELVKDYERINPLKGKRSRMRKIRKLERKIKYISDNLFH